ncbi:helix-turn-helix domain-containing protein [Lonsdalea quercina]
MNSEQRVPQEDWHPADIIAALRKRKTTFDPTHVMWTPP